MERILCKTTQLPIELVRYILLPMAWDCMVEEKDKERFMKCVIPEFMVKQAIKFHQYNPYEPTHETVALMSCGTRDNDGKFDSRQTYFQRHNLRDLFRARSYIMTSALWYVCRNSSGFVMYVSGLL